MQKRRFSFLATVLAAAAFALTPSAVAADHDDVLPLELAMNAQAMGQAVQGQERLEFTINEWSSSEDTATLLGALREMGPGAVRDQLQDMPVIGRLRVGAQLSYPVHYARLLEREGGGYTLVIATDRDIAPWETYYRTRTLDYDLVLAELRLDEDFEGSGVLGAGVMLGWNPVTDTVVVEDYDTQPVRLENVHSMN